MTAAVETLDSSMALQLTMTAAQASALSSMASAPRVKAMPERTEVARLRE